MRRPGSDDAGVKLAGMAIAAAGPAAAAHTAKQVGKAAGKGHLKARSPETSDAMSAAGPTDRVGQAGEADKGAFEVNRDAVTI